MAEQQTRAVILNGTPYIGGEDIGNTSKLTVSCAFTELSLKNYRGGGGNDAYMKRLDSVSLALDARNVSLKVLEAALGGVATVEAGASAVTGEAHPVSPDLLGKLVPTNRLQDMGATLEVTHSESGELLPLDANGEGDYRRVPGGIILKSAEAAEAGTLTFAYTAHKAARIQAMLRQGFESDLFFDGQNEATGGRWVGRFYRVRWSPSESVDLIGEDFATFAISGEVLADESRDGTTLSRFYDLSIGESFL